MDPFRPAQGYRELDHTADLAIELWAPTQEGLLVVGGLALVDIMTDGYEADAVDTRQLSLDAVDREDRLVRFMNEILVLAVKDRFLLSSAEVELGDTGLRAVLRGEQVDPGVLVTELKGVTYHDLAIDQHDFGWYGQVVIDV
jgi:SHS2 domain-containing protein